MNLAYKFWLVLLLFQVGNMSYAQNFTVTSTTDAVDAVLGDGVCDDGSGNCTLRAAIQESNALGGTHTITLAAVTYTLTLAGANENGSVTGDLDINSLITLNGVSPQTTIIDANELDRAIHILGGATLTADQVSITGGVIDRANGGGVLNEGTFTYSNGEIYSNVADLINETTGIAGGFGGGLANTGTADLTLVTIKFNNAIGSEGIRSINGGGGGGSTPGFGGGIFNDNGATLTITNSTISGNKAMGGRASRGSENNGFSNSIGSIGGNLFGGTAGAAGGGNGGNATGEFSGGGGGGSRWTGGGSGGNGGYGAGGGATGARSGGGTSTNPPGTAGFGGGNGNVAQWSSAAGGGAGAGFGGGIFNNGGNVTTTNTTISFNEALGGQGRGSQGGYASRGRRGTGLGGGIFNRSGTVNINNTLLSNNNSNTLNGAFLPIATTWQDLWGTFTSSTGHNLVFSPGTATMGGTTTGNVMNTDPALEPLSLNGGTTATHSTLDCLSPLIDAGLDAVAPAIDQCGAARIDALGGVNISDIGSFEGPDCIVLTVDLNYFLVNCQENIAVINWSTFSELDNDYFSIQKSKNGIDFETIATIQGAGTTQSELEYTWRDKSPSIGINYYRLVQTDFNGDREVFDMQKTDCTFEEVSSIYPNPFNNEFILNSKFNGTLTVTDDKGKIVLENLISSGQNNIQVNDLSPGVYMAIVIFENGERAVHKLMKY